MYRCEFNHVISVPGPKTNMLLLHLFFLLHFYFVTTPSYTLLTCNLITFFMFLFMRCNVLSAASMLSILSISASSVKRRYLATDTEHLLIRHTRTGITSTNCILRTIYQRFSAPTSISCTVKRNRHWKHVKIVC